jgi:hypothetical protein
MQAFFRFLAAQMNSRQGRIANELQTQHLGRSGRVGGYTNTVSEDAISLASGRSISSGISRASVNTAS